MHLMYIDVFDIEHLELCIFVIMKMLPVTLF